MVIYCQACKRDIGEITIQPNGKVKYDKLAGLLSSRFRFDGNWGFECDCGNDSRRSKAEEGIIGTFTPTSEQLTEIHQRLSNFPTVVVKDGKTIECDGFIMKDANA